MEPSSQQSKIDVRRLRSRNAELFVAIDDCNLDKVKELLESGVKTDITDGNNNNNTPLHSAVENDENEIVAELLIPKWKTNLNLKNAEGKTPLDIAHQGYNREIIQLLKNHRVVVSEKSRNVETALVKFKREKPETGNQKNNFSLNFQKTSGTAGIGGLQYEISLSIWLLLKGKVDAHLTEFYLASNLEKADKFDDIVFKYINQAGTSKIIFLQSKHKAGEQEGKIAKIQLTSLLSDSESGDFSLNKYFISYRKIKQHFLRNENTDDPIFSGEFDNCEFAIYTNAPFYHEYENCIREIAMDDTDLFKIKDSKGKCYQLVYDSDKKQEIFDILKDSSDCRRLAKGLAQTFHWKKGINMRQDIFQSYHKALRENVIRKTHDFNGTLSDDFLYNAEHQLRNLFFEEAAKLFKTSVDEIKLQLKTMEFKLSTKFWDQNANGFSELPNDDPVCESEIKDFLTKFRLYSSQPNEKELESSIKEIAKKYYFIQQQDIDPVYADVTTKVKNWWQDENNFLVKDNRFFEDALRVFVEFDVMEPVASFTGREQTLVDLHRMLQEGGAVSLSQAATITGLGGIGKSETVRKYLSEYKKLYDNNIIWINAESHFTITRSFKKLAQDKLKINTTDEKNNEKDTKVLADEVYNYFAKANRKSIFVFDNAEKQGPGAKCVDELLPSGLNKPYVIITTRDQDWDGMKKLSLGLFTQEEAEAFIRNALKEKITIQDHELQTLTKELDCLPLALGQAVAFISVKNSESEKWLNKQFTISCYLDQFHKNANPLLSSGKKKDPTATVMTTWKTSIEKIKLKSERAFEILHVMAYLAPDEIPIDDIFATEKGDQNEISSATELIEQNSMLSIKDRKVNIHRLVQKVTRIRMEGREQNEQVLANTFKFLKAGYPYGSDKIDDHFKKQRMLPHLEVFSSHIEILIQEKPKERATKEKEYLLHLLDWVAEGYEPYPEKSKEHQERALTIIKNYYGPDHFQMGKLLTIFGAVNAAFGDGQKSHQLPSLNEAYNGSEYLSVAKTLTNLGAAFCALGDAQNSKRLLNRSLTILENYYGPDHFQMGTVLTNFGAFYIALGDAQKSKQLLDRALSINQAYYGPHHFEVATTLNNLGNAYFVLGDAQKSKQFLEHALSINEANNGPEHLSVAETLTNLGAAFCALGDAQNSTRLLKRSLTIFEKYYGPDHFKVAITLENLGNAYGDLGNARKKKDLLERAQSIQEKYYGQDHFRVAKTLENLGNAYGSLGDAERKKRLLERALPIKKNYYGPHHVEVAITLENLGNAYRDWGDAQKSQELLERALPIKETYYGSDHVEVAMTLQNLGNAYGELGDALKKKELLERAGPIKVKYYGLDHFRVAKTLENLGEAYGALGNAEKKKELLELALPINQNYYGSDHVEVAITLENLGNAYGELGDALKKKELLERALPIKEIYYGRDHFRVAKTFENLGNVYGGLGDAQKKKELLERALPIKEKYYGFHHFEVAITLTNLGDAYYAPGDDKKSKELLERALTICKGYN